MYSLIYSTQFKKDAKRIQKQNLDISLLRDALQHLTESGTLPPQYLPHRLKGKFKGIWEGYITPDWLIMYEVTDTIRIIRLIRTGSHSELLNM